MNRIVETHFSTSDTCAGSREQQLLQLLQRRLWSRALSPSGVLVVPHDQAQNDWGTRLAHAGFVEGSSLENWTLFRLHSALTSETRAQAIAAYAHILELRLSAVYKSSTWKAMDPLRKLGALLTRKQQPAPLPERPPAVKGKDPLNKWRE